MTGRTLRVDADLTARRGDERFDVWTEDGVVVCNAPSLSALRSLDSLRNALSLPVAPGTAMADVGVTAELRVRHAPVARVGSGADPGPLDRLVGAEAELSPIGIAVAGVRALG